jgi:hypothetical protein
MRPRSTLPCLLVQVALALGGLTAPPPAGAEEPAVPAPGASAPRAEDEPLSAEPAPAVERDVASEPDPAAWATFVYQNPAPVLRLRIALEEAAAVAVATVGYVIVDPEPSIAGIPVPIWPWEKLLFRPGTWAFEADPWGTNLEGHPIAGMLYYLMARGNRVSIPEAFAWTAGAALAWELAEFNEPASINDMIMTPVGGLAIGEALTQLSGWLDRSGGSGFQKVLAWILDPPKKLHDWIDRATPVVDPETAGWHEFQAFAAGGVMWQGAVPGPARGIVQLGIQTRLFRVPGYQAAGSGQWTFSDGNVSRITLFATFQASQVVDSLFDTETAVLGHYRRDLEGSDEELRGWDLYAAVTVGYENGQHVWDVEARASPNRVALVRVPGLVLQPRLFLGAFQLEMGLEAAVLFGAIDPLQMPPVQAPPPGVTYPPVLIKQGYYFAFGLRLAPSLQIRYGALALGAAARVDGFRGATGPNGVAIPGRMVQPHDERGLGTAWFRVLLADPSLELGVRGEWRERSGSVDGVRVSQRERALLVSGALVF